MNTSKNCRVLKITMPDIEDNNRSKPLNLGKQGILSTDIHEKSLSYWVVEALKTQIAPDGTALKACSWHSGCVNGLKDAKTNPNNAELCHCKPCPSYGIWLTGYECIDTCWVEAEAKHQKNVAEARQNNLLLETFDTWAPQSIVMHSDFVNKVSKSHKLRIERDRVQRELAKLIQGPDVKNPQYQGLLDMKNRVGAQLEWAKTQIALRWKPDMGATLQDYVHSSTYKERDDLQKATDKVNTWINRGAVSPNKIAEVSSNLKTLESELFAIEGNIKDTVKQPFYFARRAYLQLNDLRWFIDTWMCYVSKFGNRRKIIDEYLVELKSGLNMYAEWIPVEKQNDVYEQVNKEQEQAAIDEANRKVKAVKELSNQQNAIFGEYIIDTDGSLIEIVPAQVEAPRSIVIEVSIEPKMDLNDLPTMSQNRRMQLLKEQAVGPKQIITLEGKISMSTNIDVMKVMSTAENLEQYDNEEENDNDGWRLGRYDDYNMGTGRKLKGSRVVRSKAW